MKRSGPPERRTPMKRGQGPKRTAGPSRSRTPIPAQSEKRRAEQAQRDAVRAACFARDGHRCVASDLVPGVPCDHSTIQCDEIQNRRRAPGNHLRYEETQSLCLVCHMLKTTEPRVAGLLGLYGPDEQARRLDAEGPGAVAEEVLERALAEWARRKAVAVGAPPSGGSMRAVLALASRHR